MDGRRDVGGTMVLEHLRVLARVMGGRCVCSRIVVGYWKDAVARKSRECCSCTYSIAF